MPPVTTNANPNGSQPRNGGLLAKKYASTTERMNPIKKNTAQIDNQQSRNDISAHRYAGIEQATIARSREAGKRTLIKVFKCFSQFCCRNYHGTQWCRRRGNSQPTGKSTDMPSIRPAMSSTSTILAIDLEGNANQLSFASSFVNEKSTMLGATRLVVELSGTLSIASLGGRATDVGEGVDNGVSVFIRDCRSRRLHQRSAWSESNSAA